MTEPAQVEIRFAALDETDPHSPHSRVVHRYEIVALGADGRASTAGPCGVAAAPLDHGITIEADPMRSSGLVRATVDVPGEASATIGRYFADPHLDADDRSGAGELTDPAATLVDDLFGRRAVEAIADTSTLRNVGDVIVVEAETSRWDIARQLAWCETEANRGGTPTGASPSVWAADSARLAQRLSSALSAWAATRAQQAARALALLSPAGALGALAPVWPAFSELVAVVRALAGPAALADLAALFEHEQPANGEWEAAFADLAFRSSAEHLASQPPGLTFRGADRGAIDRGGVDLPLLMGGERAATMPTVLLGAVADLVDPASVATEWRVKNGELHVRATLSTVGAAMASQIGGKELIAEELAAVCADADTGEVVADRGFRIDGRSLIAVLPTPRAVDLGTTYEVRIHRRGLDDRRPRRDREIAAAVDAARDALRATFAAFSGAQPEPAVDRRSAGEQWEAAGSLWDAVGQAALAQRCRRVATACRDLAGSDDDPAELLESELDLPIPLVADRVTPGVRLVLDDHAERLRHALESFDGTLPADPDAERDLADTIDAAHTYVTFSRTLGLVERSTEIAIDVAQVSSLLGRPVDEDELAEVVWRALVLGRRDDLVRDAARLLSSPVYETDEDD